MALDPLPEKACLCRLLLVVSLVLAACGGVALHNSSRHTRSSLVASYERAVHAWNADERNAFTGVAFSLQVNVTQRAQDVDARTSREILIRLPTTSLAIPLPPNSTHEPLADKGADLPYYKPLRYEGRQQLLSGRIGWPEVKHVCFCASRPAL